MKIIKWVTSDHEIEIYLKPKDIEVISQEPQDGSLKHWLIQMDDIAIFLKGTSQSMIDRMGAKQVEVVAEALREIAYRLESQ